MKLPELIEALKAADADRLELITHHDGDLGRWRVLDKRGHEVKIEGLHPNYLAARVLDQLPTVPTTNWKITRLVESHEAKHKEALAHGGGLAFKVASAGLSELLRAEAETMREIVYPEDPERRAYPLEPTEEEGRAEQEAEARLEREHERRLENPERSFEEEAHDAHERELEHFFLMGVNNPF